ncbi:MAG: DUF308 domain-containing protein [Prevotellaceae bacterium]|jgi:uncharacterized membrane protein HdeD (DUF308 family)|nr:DUF308 domain-containing protein [Prevotellaceae bacterium]
MDTIEKITPNKYRLFAQGMLFCALGAVLMIFPDSILRVVNTVIAVVVLLIGLSAGYLYYKQKKEDGQAQWYWIAGSVLALATGVCLLLFDHLLFVLLTVTVGTWLLVRSVHIISRAIAAKVVGITDWAWLILEGLLILIFAIIILLWPDEMSGAMFKGGVILIGVASLLTGIYCFLLFAHSRKPANAPQNTHENNIPNE